MKAAFQRTSLTARISLLFAVAAAGVLLLTGYFLMRAMEGHFVDMDRHEMHTKLALVRHLLQDSTGADLHAQLPWRLDEALVGHEGLVMAIADADGALWYATPGAHDLGEMLAGGDCPGRLPEVTCLAGGIWQWQRAGRAWRGSVDRVPDGQGGEHRIAVALDIGHHESFMAGFRNTLMLLMLLAVLVTSALGWFVTWRSLLTLRHFSALADGISAERLKTRLPETGIPAELEHLAQAFNVMLARLDDSFRRLSEFSSDIAHELRTPVTNLLTQAQVTLTQARGIDEYRTVLQSAIEEYERLARMTDQMLFLAKADNRLLVPEKATVDLAREVGALFEFHGIAAEEQGIRLSLQGEARVQGDRLLLRRALSNLLANAIRHTPTGGCVTVRLSPSSEAVVVAVENPSEIAPERLALLFDRFYTGDPARQTGSGTGLGLAIVRSIVELHGGTIRATSENGHTVFEMRLPV